MAAGRCACEWSNKRAGQGPWLRGPHPPLGVESGPLMFDFLFSTEDLLETTSLSYLGRKNAVRFLRMKTHPQHTFGHRRRPGGTWVWRGCPLLTPPGGGPHPWVGPDFIQSHLGGKKPTTGDTVTVSTRMSHTAS